MMMMMMEQAFAQGFQSNGGAASMPSQAKGGVHPWKGDLIQCFQKANKTAPTKDDIQYEVSEVEGGGFIAVVTVQGEAHTGEPAASKKNAEHNAAQVAVEALFPDHTPQGVGGGGPSPMMSQQMMMQMMGKGGGKMQMDQQPPGGKLKFEDQPIKCRFIHGIQLLAQRSLTKEDIVFSTEPVEGEENKFVGTVTVNVTGDTFTGKAKSSKKEAEASAVEAAMKDMGERIKPFEEEHKAKKKEKNKVALEALKAATIAKKEAKKAEQGEAAEDKETAEPPAKKAKKEATKKA